MGLLSKITFFALLLNYLLDPFCSLFLMKVTVQWGDVDVYWLLLFAFKRSIQSVLILASFPPIQKISSNFFRNSSEFFKFFYSLGSFLIQD